MKNSEKEDMFIEEAMLSEEQEEMAAGEEEMESEAEVKGLSLEAEELSGEEEEWREETMMEKKNDLFLIEVEALKCGGGEFR